MQLYYTWFDSLVKQLTAWLLNSALQQPAALAGWRTPCHKWQSNQARLFMAINASTSIDPTGLKWQGQAPQGCQSMCSGCMLSDIYYKWFDSLVELLTARSV